MRLLEVVLAGIADVEDVRDLECLDNAGVRSVVPVSKIHTAWQNLVRVGVRHGATQVSETGGLTGVVRAVLRSC